MNAYHRRTIQHLSWCNTEVAMAELCGVSRSTVFRNRAVLNMRKYHLYTQAELRYVAENYQTATYADMAEDLGLKYEQIRYIMRMLGLRVPSPQKKRVAA